MEVRELVKKGEDKIIILKDSNYSFSLVRITWFIPASGRTLKWWVIRYAALFVLQVFFGAAMKHRRKAVV